jgi:putative CocE/NonD family hydrolase
MHRDDQQGPHGRPASGPVHPVERHLDVRFVARDGVELSANLWLPAGAPERSGSVPAILEMIPYRKDDWRFNADEQRGRYFAARGFAFCRLDVRGTGRSGGIARDEYTAEETLDGYDAVEWLASRPWCNGKVAMWGISYGGFTAIQVAALRPPHLRAIVPMYATDDRYLDDVHNVGGVATASENSQYATAMVASNALPALPARPGEDWTAAWRERLERTPLWFERWLREQRDGPYWRQGSLAPDHARIEAAMLLIAGWMDGYVDAAFRMLERCVGSPRRAIVGNWVHEYPDAGYPGPNLDWLHEMVRFLDHWLKGVDNGVMDEPALVWFRRDWAPPEAFPAHWPGAWRAEPAFPAPGTHERAFRLAGGDAPLVGRLLAVSGDGPAPAGVDGPPLAGGDADPAAGGPAALPAGVDRFAHRPTTGTAAGLSWGGGGPPNGLARDLRGDEASGPVYVSPPLEADVEILGMPVAELAWEAGSTLATAVVRLSDVPPDGPPTQVTAGIRNLAHRRSTERPEPLVPGHVEIVRVPMRAAGYRFAAGHRIRLSVATSAWPVVWPSPEAAVHAIRHGGPAAPGGAGASRLILPAVPPGPGALPVPAFKTTPPDLDPVGGGSDEPATWTVETDVAAGTVTVRSYEGGETILPDGAALFSSEGHVYTASDLDPAHATMTSEVRYRLDRDGHRVEIDADTTITATRETFELEVERRCRLDGAAFEERRWEASIPRDHT